MLSILTLLAKAFGFGPKPKNYVSPSIPIVEPYTATPPKRTRKPKAVPPVTPTNIKSIGGDGGGSETDTNII